MYFRKHCVQKQVHVINKYVDVRAGVSHVIYGIKEPNIQQENVFQTAILPAQCLSLYIWHARSMVYATHRPFHQRDGEEIRTHQTRPSSSTHHTSDVGILNPRKATVFSLAAKLIK